MSAAIWRAGAVIAACAVLTGAASCAAATAASMATAASAQASWQLVKQVHSGPDGGFTAIVAVGAHGGWAFDGFSAPTAWERSGSSWTQVPFPGRAGEEVIAAGASSPSNVWAFTDGSHSRALRWDGHAWKAQRAFPGQIGGAIVIGPADVWVFGQSYQPGGGLGAWHYNGTTWNRVRSGYGLDGGSALSARDIWAFGGTNVAHWNGSTWTRTTVAGLLPPQRPLNFPGVRGILALSDRDVYAIGSGNAQDEGGPTVILRYNGHTWAKVAGGYYGIGTEPIQQASPDGRGGLWLPMPGVDGMPSYLVHYTSGHLAAVTLPRPATAIDIECTARIPGSASLLAGGLTYANGHPGTNVAAVIYQYRP